MNKNYLLVAQVFAIIGAVGWGFSSFGLLLLLYTVTAQIFVFPQMMFYIAIVIADIFAAYRLGKARAGLASKNEALGWSIFLIIGGGVIGGIFGILGSQGVGADPSEQSVQSGSLESKLAEIDNLFTKGLISRDEYLERRKKIILE